MLPAPGGIFYSTNTFAPVPTERIPIEAFLKLHVNALLLDVRSPGEYHHAHMPGAHSLPLFTDEERAMVGTAYKQQSREQAIKIGLDFFGPKMRRMVEEVEALMVDRKRPTLNSQANRGNPKERRFTNPRFCWSAVCNAPLLVKDIPMRHLF